MKKNLENNNEQKKRDIAADHFDMSEDASERKYQGSTKEAKWAESDDFGDSELTEKPDKDDTDNRVTPSPRNE